MCRSFILHLSPPGQVSQVDHESVQATALKIVLDLLQVYGFEAFNIVSPEEVSERRDMGCQIA